VVILQQDLTKYAGPSIIQFSRLELVVHIGDNYEFLLGKNKRA